MTETTDLISGMPITTPDDMNFEDADISMINNIATTTTSLTNLLTSYSWDWEYTDGLNTAVQCRKTRQKVADIFEVRHNLSPALGIKMVQNLERRYGPYGTVSTYPRPEYLADLESQITNYLTTHLPTEEKTMTKITKDNSKKEIEKMFPNPIIPSLTWVADRLNPEDRAMFIRIATEPHPVTGRTRQDALRQTGVRSDSKAYRAEVKRVGKNVDRLRTLLSNDWREFRLGVETMKLGTEKFDEEAKNWYADSYWFMATIANVARTVRTIHVVRAGYLWVAKR